MNSILITGGAGFLGTILANELGRDPENKITIIDDLSSGQKTNISSSSHFIKADISSDYLDDIPTHNQIYHLACPASPQFYQRSPLHTINTCVTGTQKILEKAKQWRARVVFTSTSEIYGDSRSLPQKESDLGEVSTISPRACYDEGKRLAETLCFYYRTEQGVDVRITRLFNTYGPSMRSDDGRVTTNFLHQAMSNKPITVYGDGQQTRSFCYVTDTVTALITLMQKEMENFQIPVINIGNDEETKVITLARMIKEITYSSSPILFKPLPTADPRQRRPDIRLARKHLGWEPKIGLYTGLAMMLLELQKRMKRVS
ncbi:NAD-dependent epimerase/dehydratase family protein [uncultured Photobacterium sp.]|uniref:NAD-dependent epimerase/dehydratase family protein n=1 Tax=uncultured Photobacterium sp. TaxID=173973 RepID=UPI00261A5E7E|nr:NAD-dependent epimerase/dehydratase family protein [uncultured Photobacterium sp.]